MLRVGLTGGIACGKSRVLARIASLGLPVLDLDAVSHQLMSPGGDAFTRVNTWSVGLPACGCPLNSNTQPWIVNTPLAVAVAVPLPTSAPLHAAIACFIVLFRSWLGAHFAAAPGLTLKFLSR